MANHWWRASFFWAPKAPTERFDLGCPRANSQALSQVVARAAVELHPWPILAGVDPEAVVLDFVQPRLAGGWLLCFGGKAGGDETGRHSPK